ncbi:MAG: prolyl oligopeptidase family serine peptidase [Candidatus Krumholzibacteria bacterium]|nr:prolyl oligopeptidase family serine peptidase [Candidatus Krumholzibacteria bacterium]
MSKRPALTLLAVLIAIFGVVVLVTIAKAEEPPKAAVENVTDEYYGTEVDDPYRYMEDLDNPQVQEWIKAQADYTKDVLKKLPVREALFKRLQELDQGKPFNVYYIIRLPNGDLFYMKRMANEELAKVYRRSSTTGEEKLLIDPTTMDTGDDQHFSIDSYSPSSDGRYVVYGLAKGGSEKATLHILDTKTGENLPETITNIENAYDAPDWLPDNSAFTYCRRQDLADDAPDTEKFKNTKAYLHALNTESDNDKLVFAKDLSQKVEMTEEDFPGIRIDEGSKYAIGKIKHGDTGELTLYAAPVASLTEPNIPWVKICDVEDQVTWYKIHEDDIYLQTFNNAPRFKVVRTSLKKPDFVNAELVYAHETGVVDYISRSKRALYVGVKDAGVDKPFRMAFGGDGTFERFELPNRSSGWITSANPVVDGVLVFTNSWTKGSVYYAYDPDGGTFADSGLQPKGKFDEVPGFESVEVMVKSHDGVMVPLSIIHKIGIELDGTHPTLMHGYGAYGYSWYVYFDALRLAWLERGGVIAVAHVRGGGEYGKQWHLAGRMQTKPNTWRDLIACAEYLVENGYTSSDRIAGQGGSAGGIMIGRAITERPDAFAAAIIHVGCLDAVRMETTANGVPNIQEFGSVKTEEGFKGLYEMSSYHHVRNGVEYPAVMLTHGMNDPRVDPWHSAKMTARLQAASASGRPVLFRVDYGVGHGIGSKRSQYLEGLADRWAFLLWQFGLEEGEARVQ